MRLSTSALVLGAASSAVAFDQKVLGDLKKPAIDLDLSSWLNFGEEITAEAKAVWEEVSMLAPDAVEAFKKQVIGTKPKKANRRPDNHWDHVVKGADVQSIWVDKNNEKHRKVGGRLDNYNLRAKKVDPSKLGVDKVKQYSGYLDDEEQDKHLFYCKLSMNPITRESRANFSKGSSSRAMTPKTTLSSSGSTAAPAAHR